MAIEVRDGITIIDGSPRMLVSADYPYYRDDPSVWADRLRAIRDDLGITVITSYIPWRHHQPSADSPPDFTGHTHPSRNVVGFLDLCHQLGLVVVAKPGPFIHAEVTYGGLPDWVCPAADPAIEPLLDAYGEPSRWADSAEHVPGRPLPAPLAEPYATLVHEWLSAVGAKVLSPAVHPHGPVVLMQIANEGIYTNGARPVTAYDYSASALAFYGDVPPRTGSEGMASLAAWGRFHALYLAEVYRRWAVSASCGVPVVVNLNPPTVEDLDAWLARVDPSLWGDVAYGFTNWMGVVSASPSAQFRYVVAAKLAPGPNLEENWGFSQLYDPAYGDAATSFHQSLLALAAGATGFNVYTGVSTSGWDASLDSATASPYPDCAPIASDGSATSKAVVVRALAAFFERHGAEFLECTPSTGASFGIYRPFAGIGAWASAGDEGTGEASCGRALRAFHDRMRAAGHDYRLVDLMSGDLAPHRRLTIPGGPYLHRSVQQALADHLASGALVTVDGPMPVLDETLTPCTVLSNAVRQAASSRVDDSTPVDALSPRARVVSGEADVFIRTHPGRDVAYLTVLVMDGNDGPVRISFDGHDLEVVAARGGAAVIRVVAGVLDDVLVKGVNGFLDSAVTASVRLDDQTISAPGDLFRVTDLA